MTTEDEVKKSKDNPEDDGTGSALMGGGGIVLVISYLVAVLGLIIYFLVVLWPPNRPKEVRDELIKIATASPSPTPSPSPSPSPGASPSPSPTISPTPAAQTTASPVLSPGVSPTPTGSPEPSATVSQSDCEKTSQIKEGFCLDDQHKPRLGVGALKFLGQCYCMYDEDRLLLIVLLCGALGGLVHGLRSFSWYAGNREAVWSWTAMYFMLPFLGAALAFVFYLVIRGGFFSPNTTVTESASPFGFAAMSALIGMFSEAAIGKLRNVAFTIFEPPQKGKDHVEPAPKIVGLSRTRGATKGGDEVTVTGTNFAGAVKVTFGGQQATVLSSSSTSIKVTTPPHDPGKVDVVVTNGDGQTTTAKEVFEYGE